MDKLIAIQQKLRSRKDKPGDGGRFKYRSAEDILEAVKPLLEEQKCAVILSDAIWESQDHVLFLKATATLLEDHAFNVKDDDGKIMTYKDAKEIAHADGFAQLDKHLTKNGYQSMSNEQCTGSASSYARKYALCGLFAIDDSDQDPDGMTQEKEQKPTTKEDNTKAIVDKIHACKNAEAINAIKDEVKAANNAYITKTFLARTKALGLEFDKEQGKYIVQSK